MDHPGFEIVTPGEKHAEAQWHGGVEPRYFVGSRVVVYGKSSGVVRARGRIEKISLNSQGRVDKMTLHIDGFVDEGDFGILDPKRDFLLIDFWYGFFLRLGRTDQTNVVSSTLNKLSPFLLDTMMRNIIGQKDSSFEMREAMDEGKILLVNLSKGDIGESNSALLGSVLVNQILIGALRRRGDAYRNGRRPFHVIVDEFFTQADISAGKYKDYNQSHSLWSKLMTWLTGTLAMLNVIVAYTTSTPDTVLPYLALFAAIYASFIAIMSGLESLHKYNELAQGFREVREIFLNSAREYEMLWHIHVRPYGDTPKACVNAAKAYNKIVINDQKIRAQAKDVTKISRTPLVNGNKNA